MFRISPVDKLEDPLPGSMLLTVESFFCGVVEMYGLGTLIECGPWYIQHGLPLS